MKETRSFLVHSLSVRKMEKLFLFILFSITTQCYSLPVMLKRIQSIVRFYVDEDGLSEESVAVYLS
jgi:hypothetical protein